MKKYVLFSLTLVGILILGIMLYEKSTREQNVFDQMYYSRVHNSFDWMNPGNPRGLFSNMKQLHLIGRDEEQFYTREGCFFEVYKSEYLNEGDRLQIDFYSNTNVPDGMIIIYYENWSDNDEMKVYSYQYRIDDRMLIYSTNDMNNEKKDFLYEIFLRDWFEANPNTKYSLDSLGSFDLVVGE